MSEQGSGSQDDSSIQKSLHEIAKVLREARHLPPEAQRELSELLDELSGAIDPGHMPSAENAHLAASAAHLMQALHEPREPGLLTGAKERLEQAALRAEAEAPLVTGILHRLIEALADLGI
jgi:hypothetical protein